MRFRRYRQRATWYVPFAVYVRHQLFGESCYRQRRVAEGIRHVPFGFRLLSIILDIPEAITGQAKNNASKSRERVNQSYSEVSPNLRNFRRGMPSWPRPLLMIINNIPEVGTNWPHLKFAGRGQRDTPMIDAKGIVEVGERSRLLATGVLFCPRGHGI